MTRRPEPRMETAGDVFGRRIAAKVVDTVVLATIVGVPVTLALLVPGSPGALLANGLLAHATGRGASIVAGVVAVEALVVFLGYPIFLLSEGLFGQTPGKRLMGLVVVKTDGSPCTVGAALRRNLVRVVEVLAFLTLSSALLTGTDDDRHTGDVLAGTVVTAAKRSPGDGPR